MLRAVLVGIRFVNSSFYVVSMEPVISVFLDSERTYIALLEPDSKGYSLAYINSTEKPIDFTELGATGASAAVEELHSVFMEIAGAATKVSISLPMESVFAHQFPAPEDMSEKNVRELVQFEISQHFPQQIADAFTSVVYTLHPRLDGVRMMLAVIVDNTMMEQARELVAPLMADADRIEFAQLAAHNAYRYNYPDEKGTSFMIVGVQKKYLDVSVVHKGELAYYHLVPFSNKEKVGELCEAELQKILDEYVPFVDGVFFFGSQLTHSVVEAAATVLSIPARRLNAFRMITTTLGERERAYCTRVAHVFPPCIGGVVPALQQAMEL